MCWNVHSMKIIVDQTTKSEKVNVDAASLTYPLIIYKLKWFWSKQYRLAVYFKVAMLSLSLCVSAFVSVAFELECVRRAMHTFESWKLLEITLFAAAFTGRFINSHTHLSQMYLPWWYIRTNRTEPNRTETAFRVHARHSDNFPFDNNVVFNLKFQYKKTHCA